MSGPPPAPPSGLEMSITKEFDSLISEIGSTNPSAVPSVEATKSAVLKLVSSSKRGSVRPPIVRTSSSGGPPATPPPPEATKKAPPAVPKAMLAKARQAAMARGAPAPPRGSPAAPRGPPRGPPIGAPRGPPRGPPPPKGVARGPPPPLPGTKAPTLEKTDSEKAVEEEKADSVGEDTPHVDTEATRKANIKKRFSASGGIQIPVMALGAMGALKKVNRDPEASKKPSRPSATFERPALRKVNRDSAKKVEDEKDDKEKDEAKEADKELDKDKDKDKEEEVITTPGPEATKEEETNGKVEEGFEWEERFDENYKLPYYFNEKTQEASWDKPSKFKPMEKKDEEGSGGDEEVEWEQRLDETHKVPFYFNLKTGEAVWEAPDAKFKPMAPEESKAEEVEPPRAKESDEPVDVSDLEWEQRLDTDHNVHFYYNLKTGEAVWEAPERYRPMI